MNSNKNHLISYLDGVLKKIRVNKDMLDYMTRFPYTIHECYPKEYEHLFMAASMNYNYRRYGTIKQTQILLNFYEKLHPNLKEYKKIPYDERCSIINEVKKFIQHMFIEDRLKIIKNLNNTCPKTVSFLKSITLGYLKKVVFKWHDYARDTKTNYKGNIKVTIDAIRDHFIDLLLEYDYMNRLIDLKNNPENLSVYMLSGDRKLSFPYAYNEIFVSKSCEYSLNSIVDSNDQNIQDSIPDRILYLNYSNKTFVNLLDERPIDDIFIDEDYAHKVYDYIDKNENIEDLYICAILPAICTLKPNVISTTVNTSDEPYKRCNIQYALNQKLVLINPFGINSIDKKASWYDIDDSSSDSESSKMTYSQCGYNLYYVPLFFIINVPKYNTWVGCFPQYLIKEHTPIPQMFEGVINKRFGYQLYNSGLFDKNSIVRFLYYSTIFASYINELMKNNTLKNFYLDIFQSYMERPIDEELINLSILMRTHLKDMFKIRYLESEFGANMHMLVMVLQDYDLRYFSNIINFFIDIDKFNKIITKLEDPKFFRLNEDTEELVINHHGLDTDIQNMMSIYSFAFTQKLSTDDVTQSKIWLTYNNTVHIEFMTYLSYTIESLEEDSINPAISMHRKTLSFEVMKTFDPVTLRINDDDFAIKKDYAHYGFKSNECDNIMDEVIDSIIKKAVDWNKVQEYIYACADFIVGLESYLIKQFGDKNLLDIKSHDLVMDMYTKLAYYFK